jgi:hypothetical protein
MSQPTDPSPDSSHDPFAPPKTPCEVQCVHCGESYESWHIEWRDEPDAAVTGGAWCCPTPGCDGVGFGFDIFPVDPAWTDENGEHLIAQFDEDDEDDDEDDGQLHLSLGDAGDEDEDEDEALAPGIPIDTFDADAFWIDVTPFLPTPLGNSPQPPFDVASSDKSSVADDDDDLPF